MNTNNFDWKNILERCLKTFIEVFLMTAFVALKNVDFSNIDKEAIKDIAVAVIIPAGSTAISAVWNTVQTLIKKSENTNDTNVEVDV